MNDCCTRLLKERLKLDFGIRVTRQKSVGEREKPGNERGSAVLEGPENWTEHG
jgi:hypothetical protein